MAPTESDQHDLRLAVERAYEIFACYPLPAEIACCDHCVDPEENAVLRQVPLLELTPQQLARYAWESLGAWGAEADFKHFLPRLLDLLVHGAFDDPALPWGLMNKISCHSRCWPTKEREAIAVVARAWWRSTIVAHPAPHGVATVLDAISVFDIDARLYLATLESLQTEASALHVGDLIWDWAQTTTTDDEWRRAVDRWVTGPAPSRLLESATLVASTPLIATRLSDAHEHAVGIYQYHRGQPD
jgi:hypothetical protein